MSPDGQRLSSQTWQKPFPQKWKPLFILSTMRYLLLDKKRPEALIKSPSTICCSQCQDVISFLGSAVSGLLLVSGEKDFGNIPSQYLHASHDDDSVSGVSLVPQAAAGEASQCQDLRYGYFDVSQIESRLPPPYAPKSMPGQCFIHSLKHHCIFWQRWQKKIA